MRIEIHRILDYFDKRPEVSALFLFGSFDTPDERPDSDIDLAVLIKPRHAGEDDLQNLIAEYYNVSPGFSLRTVDIVVLGTAPTSLKFQILKEGRVILDRNPDLRKEFTARSLQEYYDYKPIEDICFYGLSDRLRRAVHG